MGQTKGKLFVASGPSGAGKGTILRRGLPQLPGLVECVSVTTRAPSASEVDGVDYHFTSRERFQQMIDAGELLEWAEVHGEMYGTPAQWVRDQLAAGNDVLLEIDVQGAQKVRAQMPEAISIFIKPPSLEVLEQRLRSRGRDSDEVIARRLANAERELQLAPQYDHTIVNDELDAAVSEFVDIVRESRA